jgi:hypothetical protein
LRLTAEAVVGAVRDSEHLGCSHEGSMRNRGRPSSGSVRFWALPAVGPTAHRHGCRSGDRRRFVGWSVAVRTRGDGVRWCGLRTVHGGTDPLGSTGNQGAADVVGEPSRGYARTGPVEH